MPTSCWVYKRAIEIKNMKSLLWMHNFRNEHRDRARACFKEWSHDPMDGDRRRSLHRSGGPSPGVPLQVAQGCRHWDGRISDDAVWLRWPPKWVRKVKRSSEAVAMDDYAAAISEDWKDSVSSSAARWRQLARQGRRRVCYARQLPFKSSWRLWPCFAKMRQATARADKLLCKTRNGLHFETSLGRRATRSRVSSVTSLLRFFFWGGGHHWIGELASLAG